MNFFKKNENPAREKRSLRQKAALAAGALKGQPASKAVFQNGVMASALTALVLVAVILVNLMVGKLPSKYTQWDMSQNGIYSIGDTTKDLLAGLEQDVTFYYLAQSGYESESVVTFLDRYTQESKYLSWEQKDPAVYPTFAQQYGAQTASEGSIIVVSGDRSKVIDSNDLYTYDYSNYYTTGSYHARGFNYYLLPEIESHEATSGLSNLYVMLPYAQAIQTSEMENVTVDSLLTTSSSAYNKAAGYEMATTDKEEGDQEGPFDLAVAATKTENADEGIESQVIWMSSVALLNQNVNASVGGGNDQFLLGCISWLSGQDSSILIAAKSLSSETLTVSAADAAFWGNLTTIVLPVICLIAGAAITIKRRRQ